MKKKMQCVKSINSYLKNTVLVETNLMIENDIFFLKQVINTCKLLKTHYDAPKNNLMFNET